MIRKPTYEELRQRVKDLEEEKRIWLRESTKTVTNFHPPESPSPEEAAPPLTEAGNLGSIIDVDRLQSIMDDFFQLTGMVTAILDLDGNIIESTGWQDICTKFHRVNPHTAKNCTESDLFLVNNLKPGEYISYQCKNGLWDVATPLYIGGKHLGNIYTGQFLYDDDQIDEERFLKQAEEYNFDKKAYLDAFRRVPRYKRERIDHLMQFLVKLTAYISEVSYAKFHLEKEIKERRHSEARLRKSEGRLRAIFQAAHNVSFIIVDAFSPEPTVLEASPGTETIFGYKIAELIGKPVSLLHIQEDAPKISEMNSQMRQGQAGFSGETQMIRKNGEEFPALLSTYPLFDENGKIYGFLGVCLDLSEQKRLEAELHQASKMQSVGRLAGGIAHDFNNMLSIIIGNNEILLKKVDPQGRLADNLREIHKAALRSADLTRQLLAYARKQTISPKVLDLNSVVEGMIAMLKRLIGEDIDLVWLPGKDLWPVQMDPSQIDHILANLCVNARDAIKDVGRVTIETDTIEFEAAYCNENLAVKPGEYVMLAVSDNGRGMCSETLSNIFDPFFTTKESGKGTGLGLATVYGVVKQNNGFVNVSSEPGRGTSFKIYLPRHQSQGVEPTPKRSHKPVAGQGRETILLVEDEPSILKMTKTILEMSGYKVLAANTPVKAIQYALEYSGKIHLLMTDVVMPEMNGLDLSKKIISIKPDLKLLFMSGYTANVIAHHGVLEKGVNFIQKPFSGKILGRKVREALDGD
ncbi:PocR ligand-binding domain-containing protein [Dethiosulfatarculus sandiegensis]|uniref:PocR ligand-binding domain-containing protein n=1 Tax=Dethiosulfatarculus sandiegensis TaxID=1429043 RepID=UPI000698CAAE|nr:PocR ligand-binding domain-containing protein [Dethiosulfatarculus sandiegensis]